MIRIEDENVIHESTSFTVLLFTAILLITLSGCNIYKNQVSTLAPTPILPKTQIPTFATNTFTPFVPTTRPVQTRTPIKRERPTQTPRPTLPPSQTKFPTLIIPTQFQSYIGTKITSTPEGFKWFGSTVILGDFDYGFDYYERGNYSLVLLMDHSEVLDILVVDKLKEDQMILTNYCTIGGVEYPRILTLAQLDLESIQTSFVSNEKILRVWIVNLDTKKFESYPTDGIACHTDGGFDPNGLLIKPY